MLPRLVEGIWVRVQVPPLVWIRQERANGLYIDRGPCWLGSRLNLSRIACCTQDTLGAFNYITSSLLFLMRLCLEK